MLAIPTPDMKKPARPRYVMLLNMAQRAVERWVLDQADTEVSLTAPQAGALMYLARHDGALMGDVAQDLGIGAPAMSGMADRLARYGLIERCRDGRDGRIMRVYLTELGQANARRAKALAGQMNARFSDGFTDAEMDVVARWLQALPGKFAAASEAQAQAGPAATALPR